MKKRSQYRGHAPKHSGTTTPSFVFGTEGPGSLFWDVLCQELLNAKFHHTESITPRDRESHFFMPIEGLISSGALLCDDDAVSEVTVTDSCFLVLASNGGLVASTLDYASAHFDSFEKIISVQEFESFEAAANALDWHLDRVAKYGWTFPDAILLGDAVIIEPEFLYSEDELDPELAEMILCTDYA